MKSTNSDRDMKRNNRSRIFNYLLKSRNSTKRTISQDLNISMPTLLHNIEELTLMNLITITGQDQSSGGRKPEMFAINETAKVAIGIDITRNHLAFIAVDLGINILAHKRDYLPFENTAAYFEKLRNSANDFIAQLGYADSDVLGIGISVPGILSQDRSQLLYGDVIDFNGGSMDKFADVLRFPCWYSNDATAAGFAEFHSDPTLKNAVYLYLSNSVGGSIMINRQIFEGTHNKGAEFGHLQIVDHGRQCYCGLRGCLNAYCNATILASAAGSSVEAFFEQLAHGNSHCQAVWTEYKTHLVRAIRILRTIFDADVIIGGYVGSCMGDYFDEIRQILYQEQLFESDVDYIHPCKYQVEAAALGGALHYINAYIESI